METNIITENFDCVVNNFEKFINEVFSSNDLTQKTKLVKKLEEFNTVGTLYKNSKSYMPNEIWMKIMNYLKTKDVFGNFALVCKRFHGLTITPGAIKNIHLSYFRSAEDKFKIEKVSKVLERSHQLKSLAISDCCTSFLNTFAILAFQSCPRLKSLKIKNCQRRIYFYYLNIQFQV